MKSKNIYIASAVVLGIIAFLVYTKQPTTKNKIVYYSNEKTARDGAVREENGVQIIHVIAKNGYSPKNITATAGKPTKFEMETNNTYDCSSSFTIPALKYRTQLPATGTTLVDIPAQEKGTKLTSLCGMGMYKFDVLFN